MKTIIIIGSKEAGKTTLFQQLVKHYSPEKRKGNIKPSPVINYTENLIQIQDKTYNLIDTSFECKDKSSCEYKMRFLYR